MTESYPEPSVYYAEGDSVVIALPEVLDLIDDSGDRYRAEIVLRGHQDPIVALHAVIEHVLDCDGGDLRDITLMNDGMACRISYALPAHNMLGGAARADTLTTSRSGCSGITTRQGGAGSR